MQIHIPQPCSESWSEMSPAKGGRFCAKCAHTVIDFSGMRGEEIALYLQLNAGTNICGRFRTDQLMTDLPTPDEFVVRVLKAPLSLLRQIAAIIIFTLFISSFSALPAEAQRHTKRHAKQVQPLLTGEVAVAEPPVTPPDTQSRNEILGRMSNTVTPKGQIKPGANPAPDTRNHAPDPAHELRGKVAPYRPQKK